MLSEIWVAWLFFFYLIEGDSMDGTEMTDGNGNGISVQGTNQLLQNLEATVPTNRKEKSRIVEPGAKFAQDNLWRNAPYLKHKYPSQMKLGSKYRDPQHLRDAGAVTHKPNQFMDGSTDVGFIRQAAPIARWVDQGTYRQNPQFFIEHTFENMDYDMLFALQAKAYSDLTQEKIKS